MGIALFFITSLPELALPILRLSDLWFTIPQLKLTSMLPTHNIWLTIHCHYPYTTQLAVPLLHNV
ncbi:hypothetical protein NRG857_17923 [Escherichia coli O83:H1 str. NRG 857C]|uniref:Uncharacterized protein n=1 Tax=Escherichia coli O83:H1 (strain NRG 857C / AIEC) TaxID=685038 RepID=A0A0H3EN16_ECO8N|nr:hypothetical protein NRG857_17923 [Escherichia coli O83:H1 str. NRG 857C]